MLNNLKDTLDIVLLDTLGGKNSQKKKRKKEKKIGLQ